MAVSSYGIGVNYGTTYFGPPEDIYATSFHAPPRSYMLSPYSLSADANGDIIVEPGTVLAASSYDVGCACPYDANSTTTVIGVLAGRYNLRTGIKDVAMQDKLAVLREDRCRDNGVYGTVRAGSKTALAAMGITFTKVDN